MSLKAFHLLFLAASVLLALGFAGYENYRYWQLGGSRADLFIGFASSAIGFALLIYSFIFLRKTRHIELI